MGIVHIGRSKQTVGFVFAFLGIFENYLNMKFKDAYLNQVLILNLQISYFSQAIESDNASLVQLCTCGLRNCSNS